MKKCGIYKITSPSGKMYIGQSKDIDRRWKLYRGHYVLICKNYKRAYPRLLMYSLRKYGHRTHAFEILELCNADLLNEREKYWIAHFDTHNSEHGMNFTKGGEGVSGYKWSDNARKKQSRALKGKKPWNIGLKPTPELLEKNRNSQIRRWEKIKSDPNFNSEENRLKRKVNKKCNWSEVRKKVWVKVKDEHFYSIEAIEKRSDTARKREQAKRDSGYKPSQETKMKNSLASLKMWAERRANGTDHFTGKALENIRKCASKARAVRMAKINLTK